MNGFTKSNGLEGVRGCIFDLDGVIVDTARYHFLAWKRLAEELGYPLSLLDNEQLKGVSRTQSLQVVLRLAEKSLNPEQKEILANKKNAWFNEYIGRMRPEDIFPGVRDLIRKLREEGMKIGLASSSRNARTVIRVLDIENDFDAIVDGNMIKHTKPDPEIFLLTASMLGLAPAQCVVIEDAEAGIEAALSAGMKCIGIGSPVLLRKANRVFPKTSDIDPSIVRQLEMLDS